MNKKQHKETTEFKIGDNNTSGWFTTGLLLLFIGLKLSGVISWSWWWVLSPFWIPLAIVFVVFFVLGIHVWSKK